jgi:protease-4
VRKFWIVFTIVAVLLGGGLGLLLLLVVSLGDGAGGDVDSNIMRWEVAGPYAETAPEGFMEQLQAGDAPTFSQLLFGLRRAARDPEIDTFVLDLRGSALNWAQLEELHGAVMDMRRAGKQVWAYVESGGNAEYALAAAADRIAMAPEGNLMILGVAAELAFVRETLDKVGMRADFLSVGKYKSAPEQLTRSEASEANREQTRALVDGRYDLLVDMIASGRGRDRQTVARWIDTAMYDGESALAAGLVDTLVDIDDLLMEIAPDTDLACLECYAREGGGGRAKHTVALLVAEGTIYPGESRYDALNGRILGSDTVIDQLVAAAEDEDVDAVLLRVDSPGGSALASDLIWREIERTRAVKPVVVSMGRYAASGGYYISCGADSIFADAGTVTGSIGVFAGKMDQSGMYDKLAVHREFITRGENALFFSDAGPFTPAQRTYFQAQLDRFYERFLAKVGQGRNMERDAVHAVAQGRVWTGYDALAVGLVDGIGGLERALASVKAMIGVPEDGTVELRVQTGELDWLESFMLDALRSSGAARSLVAATGYDPLATLPQPLAHTAGAVMSSGMADVLPLLDGRPVALMPWRETERHWPAAGR